MRPKTFQTTHFSVQSDPKTVNENCHVPSMVWYPVTHTYSVGPTHSFRLRYTYATNTLMYNVYCILYVYSVHIRNDRTRNFLPNPNRTEPPIFFAESNRTETEPNSCAHDLRSYQLKLIKMRAELANLNHCAVPL